jgi:hypothetical protein
VEIVENDGNKYCGGLLDRRDHWILNLIKIVLCYPNKNRFVLFPSSPLSSSTNHYALSEKKYQFAALIVSVLWFHNAVQNAVI